MTPLISQYWDGEAPPDYVTELCATFRDLNPDFSHRLFDQGKAEAFIAEHFGEREAAAFRACAVPAMQADYFRYCVAYALGGVYADADAQCVAPLRSLVAGCSGRLFLSPTVFAFNGLRVRPVWVGLLVFPAPGHPLLRLALEIATANIEARIAEHLPLEDKPFGIALTAGPGVLTMMRMVYERGSVDDLVNALRGTAFEPFGEVYRDATRDRERVNAAFAGVRVSPYECITEWVEQPQSLPYKETDIHWTNFRAAIFRGVP